MGVAEFLSKGVVTYTETLRIHSNGVGVPFLI
jgi:hypothetical protein